MIMDLVYVSGGGNSGIVVLLKDVFEMIPSFILAYAFHDIP